MNDLFDRLRAAVADRYRIERELGQGGMAMVYLAHDLRHERRVALKILRPELAAVIGAERFLAEIKTTANLQHPHILPLHDSGEAGGSVFYVMPYVEGESLRKRLDREKQLPVEDAIKTTREVAAALDYAHRHGVIHRDIKPENILLHDGTALVADFGIALAVSTAGGGSRMTETGMSLGTPHYMSPEQAMGERELTPRSDVYALGCVLYEMLVGEPPFTGPTPQAIVAKVITEKPPLATTARESVPRNVSRVIQKALAKLPADRFGSAAAMAEALGRPGWTDPEGVPAEEGPPVSRPGRRLIAGLGGLALVATVAALWGWLRPRPDPPVIASYLKLPADESLPGSLTATLAPDGSALAYVGPGSGDAAGRIWVKRRSELHGTPLAGTDGVSSLFFSPDARWIAFFAGAKLKKVPSSGGGVISLADVPSSYQWGGWLDDDRIVFAGPSFTLKIMSADGGTAETVVGAIPGRGAVGAVPLPGSRGFFYAACGINCSVSDLWVHDLEAGQSKKLLDNVLFATYAHTGHLLYSPGDGTVLAAPFDLASLTVEGPGVPVLEGLARFRGFEVTRTGTLFYQEGEASTGTPVWVTRDGRATEIDSAWKGEVGSVALSPDGRRLALTHNTVGSGEQDVWIKELDRGPLSRLTFGEDDFGRPAWTPDGRSVLFVSGTTGRGRAYQRRADGTGPLTILADSGQFWSEAAYSRDGRWLVIRTFKVAGPVRDIFARRTTGDTTLLPIANTAADEYGPTLSPDGRWVAYTSQETGSPEVYVRPFPNAADGKYQVSANGGSEPLWSHSGREIFYVNASNQMVAASVAVAPSFSVTGQKVLFSVTSFQRDATHRLYDVAPGDQRFLMVSLGSLSRSADVIVENWTQELKAKLRR